MSTEGGRPVFYDARGTRWRRVRTAWLALAIAVTSVAAIFIASVIANPILPGFNLRPLAALPHASDTNPKPPPLPKPLGPREKKVQQAVEEMRKTEATTRIVPARKRSRLPAVPPPAALSLPPPPASNGPPVKSLFIAFYVNWDDSSYSSLKRNIAQLDWVVPEWIRLQSDQTIADPLVRDIDTAALNFMRQNRPEMPILPLVQNYVNEQWNPQVLARAVATADSRKAVIDSLVSLLTENKFGGVCVDFEEAPPESQANLLQFMKELHAAFQPNGWIVSQAVPFDNPDWDYKAYAAVTDYLMLMAYDQHWSSSAQGPIAAEDWFEQTLKKRITDLSPAKTILSLGSYGYDWTRGGTEATEVTFQEAVLSASDSQAKIIFDGTARNPHFEYDDDSATHHDVWFLDAVTAYNQMRAAINYRCAGFALWRLGSEDPSLWAVFGSKQPAPPASGPADVLRPIRYGYDVDFEGTGEILQVTAVPRDGARDIKTDGASGLIAFEDYTATPSSYVIQRTGDHQGLIALTFDDGPDPIWTTRILDILKQEGVPASFFIIGQNGAANPGLVRRIVDEGHDLGNHTYTHPNLGEIPGRITDLELTATQRLIESLTGRGTTLFRPPYFGDAEPQTPDEVDPVMRAKNLGYITIGLHIDPDDWARPGVDQIVQRTIAGAINKDPETRGEVVLLHDGGGDRQQTVEALPQIIQELRSRGYRFVTISQLAGITRDQAMPPLPAGQSVYPQADALAFYGFSIAGRALHWIFLIGIVLGLGRMLIIGGLALAQWFRERRREREHLGESYQPAVSIIVPAFNEEAVIAATIKSLLASDYPRLEVIVVDDGSSDRTSEVVREQFGPDPRVKLFTEENAGKAEALNLGLRHTSGEIIVALDADTVFVPETIAALGHRFYDPGIGAIAGNAKVGNRVNIITRWQALEYVTSQNLDRRAFASLNCITVVPGAVGAWRRSLLDQVGGFASDTLAEDQDVTIKVRRLGYKIGYSARAVAWTEAPDTVRALAKQRFRWSFGTLQCMWKHRDALFRPRYGALGWVAMPNVWIFQILFPLVSPVMDLMLVWSLISAGLERLEHPSEYAITNLKQIVFYYCLFLAVDWLAAAFAFLLERKERWRLLWWLLLQRFCYRQVMYYVMVKSVASAARGGIVGWGKLERKATAHAGH